jgi:hypothetical protein
VRPQYPRDSSQRSTSSLGGIPDRGEAPAAAHSLQRAFYVEYPAMTSQPAEAGVVSFQSDRTQPYSARRLQQFLIDCQHHSPTCRADTSVYLRMDTLSQ